MDIFYAPRRGANDEIIQNFNMRSYRDFIDLGLLRSDSVYDFKTVSAFVLATFGTTFDVIF